MYAPGYTYSKWPANMLPTQITCTHTHENKFTITMGMNIKKKTELYNEKTTKCRVKCRIISELENMMRMNIVFHTNGTLTKRNDGKD